MNSINLIRWTRLSAVLPLALVLLIGQPLAAPTPSQGQERTAAAAAPPSAVQGQSFSIGRGDPSTATGVHPADILGIGGAPLIPCENLGLLCWDETGELDDVVALSFGDDFTVTDLPSLQFSVDADSQGAPNSAVRREANCSPAQAQGDAFETSLDGANQQDLDGDGVACAGNEGYGLSLAEGVSGDNLDALAPDPCQSVDINCDGVPEAPIYFALAPNSPTLAMLGATSADILVYGQAYVPVIWANGVDDLGLGAGDMIDGLCLQEDGDWLFGAGDQIVFSLAPGSPTLAALGIGPGELLLAGRQLAAANATTLGLNPTDNVDALACTQALAVTDLYLPLISR